MPYRYIRPSWCQPKSERDREIYFMMHSLYDLYGYHLKPSLLDVGFAGSGYIEMISDLGIDFTGLDGDLSRITGQSLCYAPATKQQDIRKWHDTVLSRIKYIHADIVDYKSDILYDIVISISSIEHIVPIEYDYHHDFDFYRDIKAVDSMKKLVKPDGHLLLTFPCGLERILSPHHRNISESLKYLFIPSRHYILIYDISRIKKIIDDWNIVKEKYWINPGNIYKETNKEKALNFEYESKSTGTTVQTLCALLLKRPS